MFSGRQYLFEGPFSRCDATVRKHAKQFFGCSLYSLDYISVFNDTRASPLLDFIQYRSIASGVYCVEGCDGFDPRHRRPMVDVRKRAASHGGPSAPGSPPKTDCLRSAEEAIVKSGASETVSRLSVPLSAESVFRAKTQSRKS